MNTTSTLTILTLALCAVVSLESAQARARGRDTQLGIGGQWHNKHEAFEELPFEDDDLSYGLSYFINDQNGSLMLAATYASEPGGTNGYDYAITPQINLLFTDGGWRAGPGILSTYTKMEDGEDDWMDLYYQFLLGYRFPIKQFKVDLFGIYPFERPNKLDEFDFGDMQYGAWISKNF